MDLEESVRALFRHNEILAIEINRSKYGPFSKIANSPPTNSFTLVVNPSAFDGSRMGSPLPPSSTLFTMSTIAEESFAAQSPLIIRPCEIVNANRVSDAMVASADSKSPLAEVSNYSFWRAEATSAIDCGCSAASSSVCCCCISNLAEPVAMEASSSRVIRRALPTRMVRVIVVVVVG